jgi:hypothetical protein
MAWTREQSEEAARLRTARHTAREERLRARREQGRREAERLAREIGAADPSVMTIWGFGSVFEKWRNFREDSDLDLAAEGGTSKAWKISQTSDWKVDWVELENQDPDFAEQIRKKGTVLYERFR